MPDAVRNYNEFFTVDEGYYPEINPDSIKGDLNGWMKTWPHPTFVELLEKTERMLAREARGKKHCIWVQGAFGTGKSRVIWTIRELLCCSDEKLNEYFDEYPALQVKSDLRNKMLGHKHGRIVTAFRYSSGDISNTRKLIMAIYESVSDALKKSHYDYLGTRTIRGQIAAWLEDEGNQQIFQIMLNKPQYRSKGSFAGKTPADILSQLRSSGNADALINDILDLSENERIGVYDLSMDDLKAWLTDVIDNNQLTALVLLWDEFSSYFKQNLNTLDQLQSLVELCAVKPFEMMIVTHEIGALDKNGENTQLSNIVRDRFEVVSIEMPDNVAFDLIGHAMKPNEAAHDTWLTFRDDIAGRASESLNIVSRAVGVDELVLKKMTPIHPMAALMLKHISERFASNQRSMFNFIKSDESEDLHAFQWFISTHSPENAEMLTMDYLWDFFYEKGHDEHGSGAGRSNLDVLIAGVLDTFPQNEQRLNNEQQRVLKVVLMMQAISRRINNAIPLLRPTEKNVKLAFEGDDSFSTSPVLILKNQLVNQLRILFSTPVENDLVEYATATVQGDQPKIDEIIARIKAETTTGKLMRDAQLDTAITLSPSEKMRFRLTPVTVDDFTRTINRLSDHISLPEQDYHIYGVICYVKDEAEQTRMQALIADVRRDSVKRKLLIIDASGIPMGLARYNEWAKYAGNEEYWRPKDPELANNHKRNLNEILKSWRDSVLTENLIVYYGDHFERTPGSARALREDILPRIVLDQYPLSFDNARVSESFFSMDRYAAGAKCGIKREAGGIYQQNAILGMLQPVWNVPEYWTQPSLRSLPISVLKQQIDELISSRFVTDVRISHSEILSFLFDRGFMPCNLYAFLTGFLLKEYSEAPYRYGIGENGDDGDTQNPDKLSEHIGECFKYMNPDQGIRNYKEKYIEIMSQEQKAFVDFVHDAFDVAENSSVERAASRMRTKLKELSYPIWCYKVVDRANLGQFLDRIAEIANDRGNGNVPTQAKRLGKLLLDVHASSRQLIELLTTEHGEEALREFLEDFRDGELLRLAQEIGAPNVLEDVRNALSTGEALWLWSQETGEEEINKLIVEYQIVSATNAFTGYSTFDISHEYPTCITKWKDCAKYTHIPSTVIQEKEPDLREWVQLLREIVTDGSLSTNEKKEAFRDVLTNQRSKIHDFLNNRPLKFSEYFVASLQSLDMEANKRIYAGLPQTSFTDSKSDFIRRVNDAADQERAAQKITQLRTMWREYSGFNDAHSWSDHYQTPILALVPEAEQQQAKRLFATLKSHNASDTDITASLTYLESHPSFLEKLKDQVAIDAAFVRELIGNYKTLISVEEARQAISNQVPADPYDWMIGNTARMLSASAHKFNGPKGIGFLYIRKGVEIESLLHGGAQESGMRAGTENVAAIVAMSVALHDHICHMEQDAEYLNGLSSSLLQHLREKNLDFIVNGAEHRIPGNLSLSFKGIEGERILHRLDLMGTMVATGSACDSKDTKLSHVIQSIRVPQEYAYGTIRITLGIENTEDETRTIAEQIAKILQH